MLEAKISHQDSDLFDVRPIDNDASLIDQLRPYLTANEIKLLGFTPANDEDQKYTYLPSFLVGLGATASTTILFTVVAFLATLGMPEVTVAAAFV